MATESFVFQKRITHFKNKKIKFKNRLEKSES